MEGKRPRVLLVCHVGGGGTERHVHEIAEILSRLGHVFLLKIVAPDSLASADRHLLSLRPLSPRGEAVMFDPKRQFAELIQALRGLDLSRIHFQHTLGHEDHLQDLVHGLQVPYDVTLHDYLLLSPSLLLCGPNAFHGEPDSTNEVAEREAQRAGYSLESWRAQYRWLLDEPTADSSPLPIPTSRDATYRIRSRSHQTPKVVFGF
jgi:glycosyltransferase involved in cell wall biosynthesis